MEEYSAEEDFDAYRVSKWLSPGQIAHGYDKGTLEPVYIKTQEASPLLECEASTLRALSGGPGIPTLRWFGNVKGQELIVMDGIGPSIEELFERRRHNVGPLSLALLADQMLSRLEWMHSRHIIHGNLSPASFAIGNLSWQMPQLVLVDFATKTSISSSREDLEAVGNIILYLSSQFKTWVDFQAQAKTAEVSFEPLRYYFDRISGGSLSPGDYGTLRQVFHRPCRFSSVTSFISNLAVPRANGPDLRCLATASTSDLFEILGSKLSAVGGKASIPMTPWKDDNCSYLLRCLNDILAIYLILLVRDKPSRIGKVYLVEAYHLPNRLWRDLRWYLSTAQNGPVTFRKAIVLNIYRFIGLMLDIVPIYNAYWTKYLAELSSDLLGLDLMPREVWHSVLSHWRMRNEALDAAILF
ncbi:hypothetical protein PENSTE_c014G02615 [Penicillium steckii]|uniref:Protein kinase domain-containing protein n=1 Tax=Penicillium steckii TaxID=303698 RepID=A0A1V6T1L8_9EURO|nr:hypothetical protein PENSTE_c014G02615 [Penicillium steckii]